MHPVGKAYAESTKNRNRKAPWFPVAKVSAASQTAVGTLFFLFLEKSPKESQSLAIFRRKDKSQGFLGGGGHFWGPKNRCEFSTCVQNVAIAIAGKW